MPEPLAPLESDEIALRKYEARFSLYKVMVGSFAVGALGVIIPGAVDWWSFKAEQQRLELQAALDSDRTQQSFISEYFNTAISEDIELRIRFAEYFSEVAPGSIKGDWASYLKILVAKRDDVRSEIDRLEAEVRGLMNSEADDLEFEEQVRLAELERRLEWLYREIGYVERGRSVVPSIAENKANPLITFSLEEYGFSPFVRYFVFDPVRNQEIMSNFPDEPIQPASIAKLMTLYVAFEKIRDGEISLDDDILVSHEAASKPPSKLGLQAGDSVKLHDLIVASAIKSANDAATAIAEAISGNEATFSKLMNETASRIGLESSTFSNATGLANGGLHSTPRDLAVLMSRIYLDFPDQFHLFSMAEADIGSEVLPSTGRRHLQTDPRVIGVKTGYSRLAGFTVAMVARQGGEVRIVVIAKATSTASRTELSRYLLDKAFE